MRGRRMVMVVMMRRVLVMRGRRMVMVIIRGRRSRGQGKRHWEERGRRGVFVRQNFDSGHGV